MILLRLSILPCILLVSCQDLDQESRGLPPEPHSEQTSQVRDVSDGLSHHFDEKEWQSGNQQRKDRQIEDVAATSQLSKDRITALFGADARPAYGHRDPETGKVNLSPNNIQERKGLSTQQASNRVADDIAEPENNEINPFDLFPPGFHDLLNIPIHVYGNGSTLNPHEKFNKKPKQPLVSSGYSNTKLQGGKSTADFDSEEYTERPLKKTKYRTTTTADYSSESDFEPTKRPSAKYSRRPLNPQSFKPLDRDRAVAPDREQFDQEPVKQETVKPFRPVAAKTTTEKPPIYVPVQTSYKPKKLPEPVDAESYEDDRTYSRPYEGERYPATPKPKNRRPESSTVKKDSYFNEPTPAYEKKPQDLNDQRGPYRNNKEPETLSPKKPAHVYDDDIIYDYDDERNTGDKAVFFHVSKPESDLLKETNSHGLPPHATRESPARPTNNFPQEAGPRPTFNPDTRPRPAFTPPREEQRPNQRPNNIQEYGLENRKPEFKPSPPILGKGEFPSVFNSDSPFTSSNGQSSQPQLRQPAPPRFDRNDYAKPSVDQRQQRPHEAPRPQSNRPVAPQKGFEYRQQQPPRAAPDSFQGQRPSQSDFGFARPPQGEFRQDVRQPPREQQASGPLSSITNMFSSLFGRKSDRSKRSVDEEPIAMESQSIPSIRKLDRSELAAIQQVKEQIAPDQDGTPPHFYFYPPGKKVPLLVVGPFTGEAPLVEGAELVHVETIGDLPAVSEPSNSIGSRSSDVVAIGSDKQSLPTSGFKKPPPTESILQRRPTGEQSVAGPLGQKPSPTRNGIVFPKKKSQDVPRKPIEAALDPISSELTIPENVSTVEDPESEETLTEAVAAAVKNSVGKLKPLLRFRNKDAKKELVTPTGQHGNPALVRAAKPGSVPDIPFAAPIHLIPQSQGQQAEPTMGQDLPLPALFPEATRPLLFTPSSDNLVEFQDTSSEMEAKPRPDSVLVNVSKMVPGAEAETTVPESDDTSNAEKYLSIPVKSQLSENGVFIIQASSLPDAFEDRADTEVNQLPESAQLSDPRQFASAQPQQQPAPISSKSGLPPLNLPLGLLQQLSGLAPPQNLAQPIAIRQGVRSPIPVPTAPAPTAPIHDNRPPLFPLNKTPQTENQHLTRDPGLTPSQPPPLVQARPPIPPAAAFNGISGESATRPKPTPVFFQPQVLVEKSQIAPGSPSNQGETSLTNNLELVPAKVSSDKKQGNQGNNKFSSQFKPDSVKTFKVGPDGKPLNVRPRPTPTTERIATLPPGATAGPPQLVGLDAPFIPSQRVNNPPSGDSALEGSNPRPVWQALGKVVENRSDQLSEGSVAQPTVTSGDPFIEIGGFLPIFPQK